MAVELDITPRVNEAQLEEVAARARAVMKQAVLDGIRDALAVIAEV